MAASFILGLLIIHSRSHSALCQSRSTPRIDSNKVLSPRQRIGVYDLPPSVFHSPIFSLPRFERHGGWASIISMGSFEQPAGNKIIETQDSPALPSDGVFVDRR